MTLPGRHLLSDVLAATAVGCLAGAPAEAMQRAVEGFRGLEHALERVAEVDGVRFVNDSKATNIAAATRAIESFDSGVVAIGEAAPFVAQALAGVVPVSRAETMDNAVRTAFEMAKPGGVVVLAPACSSFDMFRDYAARGHAFKEAVRRLEAEARQSTSGASEPGR